MKKVVSYHAEALPPWRVFMLRVYNTFIRVSQEARCIVYRQIAQMILVGIPLTRAIDAIRTQERNNSVKEILRDIYVKVVSGVPFSTACNYHPELFPQMYIPLLRTGEVSGNLDIILNDITAHAEEQLRVHRMVINNLTYPLVAVGVGGLVLTVIFFFCFPGFIDIFSQFNMKLPLITRIVIHLYKASTNPYVVLPIIGGTLVFFIGVTRALNSSQWLRIKTDQLKMYIPIVGVLYQKLALSTFCRAFVLLYKSGINFLEIFHILPTIMDNTYMQSYLKDIIEDIKAGSSLGVAFEKVPFIPPMLSQSMAVAEETGNLEVLIPKVAEYFERDAEYTTEKILTLMEPLAVVVISGLVFVIILSVFLPLLQLISAFGTM